MMGPPDKLLRKALLAIAAAPALAVAFLGLVCLAFSVPNAPIAEALTDRPDVLVARRANNGRVIDADTECIGLSVGLYEDADTAKRPLMERAVRARSLYGCEPLIRWLETGETNAVRDYFRYWHGYIVLARPLLAVMPYNDLRGLLFTACLVSFSCLLWRLGADFGPRLALAFALPFLVLNTLGYWVVATKAVTWLLAMGAGLILSRRRDPEPALVFFGLGALTAFFDFLTAPAFVFAFALLVWRLYAAPLRGAWTVLAVLSGFWLAGYAGLWLCKIAIADIMLPEAGVWRDAGGAVLDRLRGANASVSGYWPGAALISNLEALKSVWMLAALLVFGVAPTLRRGGRRAAQVLWRSDRLSLAIAAIPLVWLEVLSNHSQIHAAFTQLNLAPAFILSGLLLVGESHRLADQRAGPDPDC